MKKLKHILPIVLITLTLSTQAQLKGDHILGDAGLQSGTQAPPGLSVAVPLYFYNASKLKNSSGDVIANPNITAFVTGAGVSYVSDIKILNANWGASVLFGFASNKLEGNSVNSKSPFAFSDTYIQPVQLGWHTKRADFTAGYALYLPTGRYSVGGDNNSGLGMLGNEFSAGTTLYLDKKKSWNFSALFSYELHSKKKNSDIKAGDDLNIEGGIGKTIYKKVSGPVPMIFNMGLIYYMQFKTTTDNIPPIPTSLLGSKDHVYALGLEGSVFLPHSRTVIGLRWLDEFSAINRFQGNTFFITLAQMIKTKK